MKRLSVLCVVLALAGCASGSVKDRAEASGGTLELLQEADAAYAKGKFREAEMGYRAATQSMPMDFYAWFKLGNVYAQTNRTSEAILAYREALTRSSGNSKAYYNLSLAYLIEAQRAVESSVYASKPSDPHASEARALRVRVAELIQKPLDVRAEDRAFLAITPPPEAEAAPAPQKAAARPQWGGQQVSPSVAQVAPVPEEKKEPAPGQPVQAELAIPPTAEPPSAMAVHKGGQQFSIVPEGLYLREGPDMDALIVLRMEKGDRVEILPMAPRGGWQRVRFRDKEGWAFAKLLSPAAHSATAAREIGQVFAVTPNGLALREQPDFEAPVVVRLNRGDRVEALPVPLRAGWRRVKSGDHEGWVFSKYLGAVPARAAAPH